MLLLSPTALLLSISATICLSASINPSRQGIVQHGSPPLLEDGVSLKHLSRYTSDAGILWTQNWAGAALMGSNLTAVTGLVKIPTAATPPGGRPGVQYATTTWVGIDGVSCSTDALLQAGVDTFVQNGRIRYEAWYEWYPQPSIPFPNFAVKEGDVINITVVAWTATSGIAILENQTTGKNVSHTFNRGTRLCFSSAEWVVEDFSQGSQLVDFANFTSVTFTNVSATTGAGTVLNNTGSQILGIRQRNKIFSDCSTPDSSTVHCSYTNR